MKRTNRKKQEAQPTIRPIDLQCLLNYSIAKYNTLEKLIESKRARGETGQMKHFEDRLVEVQERITRFENLMEGMAENLNMLLRPRQKESKIINPESKGIIKTLK